MARPTKYTKEIADKICEVISTSPKSLKTIAQELNVTVSSVHKWLSENKEFSDKYARAHEDRADFLAEEILEIADSIEKDTIKVNKFGKLVEVENTEWVNRSKLKIDARKWVASKLKPKKYGDKLDVDASIKHEVEIFKGINLDVKD